MALYAEPLLRKQLVVKWLHREAVTVKVYATKLVEKCYPQDVTQDVHQLGLPSIYASLVLYVAPVWSRHAIVKDCLHALSHSLVCCTIAVARVDVFKLPSGPVH